MKHLFMITMICALAAACSSKKSPCCAGCAGQQTASDERAAMKSENEKPLTCKLSTPELQQRKATVIAEIKSKYSEKKELPDGFAFKFQNDDKTIDLLTEFIKSERQCCDFFDFAIRIKSDDAVWLEITGPKGVKEFITAGLEL